MPKKKSTTHKQQPKAVTPKMSLSTFNRQDKMARDRADCLICKLPEEIQQELASAVHKGIKRDVRVRWLKEQCGLKESLTALTDALRQHLTARHYEGL